jgi:hypothetical protein
MTTPTTNAVRISLPSSLAADSMPQLFTRLGLLSSPNPDGSWNVRRPSTPTDLVKTLTLAAPWLSERKFDLLNGYASQADKEGLAQIREWYEGWDAHLEQRRAAGDPTAWLFRAQAAVMAAADSDAASTADHADATTIGKLADGNNGPRFPGRSCHAVIFNRELKYRSKLPQILIGLDQDPQLLADLNAAAATGHPGDWAKSSLGEVYDSNSALLDLMLGATYLAPLLGCCSPWAWAVQGQRLYSVLIFALGRPILGVEFTPVEPLQLMPHAFVYDADPDAPTLAPKSCAEAIEWWVLKLEQMFAYLSYPTYFRDANSNYLPYLHQNWMMTFDQLFQRLGSIATSYRDVYAQQVLMFGAMDAIGDRIYGCGSQSLYRPTRAQEALEKIRNSIPEDAAKLLLPQAERAVTALTDLQDGFFIRKHYGTQDVRLVNSKGNTEHWDMDHATKELLTARRNATHGFGNWKSHDADNVRILAHHDAQLPRSLVHLPYLYLLEILCTPAEVISTITAAGDAVT